MFPLGAACVLTFGMVSPAAADRLEVLSPDSEERAEIEIEPNEVGELEIFLKSLGDMVGGYRLIVLDDDGRQVGKNISDANGVVKFTGLSAGRFRILVERRVNDRGARSSVRVGQINLSKRLKSSHE